MLAQGKIPAITKRGLEEEKKEDDERERGEDLMQLCRHIRQMMFNIFCTSRRIYAHKCDLRLARATSSALATGTFLRPSEPARRALMAKVDRRKEDSRRCK